MQPVRVVIIDRGVNRESTVVGEYRLEWSGLKDVISMDSDGDLVILGAARPSSGGDTTVMVMAYGPNAHVPMRTEPEQYFCYIAEGDGRLRLDGGHEVCYAANDCIVFRPETAHAWEGGAKETVMLVVQIP